MDSKKIETMIDELNLNDNIKLSDIPELDLYMDQVIQLFEGKLSGLKRNEDDKILTKTMINNYAKAKLFMSIKNKKYTKDHLILMSVIYELKGALSINDIKILLKDIVDKSEEDKAYDLRDFYCNYLENRDKDTDEFVASVKEKSKDLEDSFEDKFLLVCSMISMSNMYRRMGEKLIDEFFVKDEEKKWKIQMI